MPHDYYKILGISHAADLQKIQQATQTRANEIKTAFAVLSQADTRTAYDAKLDLGPHNHYATLLVKKLASTAEIKTAAQARMKEIKEAYETLSKPDTRKAYDSQLPPVKPTTPVASEKLSKPATRTTSDSHCQPLKPSTPVAPSPPKRENVVVEQKPVSPPDRDKSQVSPYRPSPLMQTNCLSCNAVIHRPAKFCPHCGVRPSALPPNSDADRHTTEIELAGRGTRLRAVINDVLIMLALYVFPWLFLALFSVNPESRVASLVRGVGLLSFIGLIMINLVLLYRHGQTLGKRVLSIKIVDADGSRAGLLRILLVRNLVTLGILFLLTGIIALTLLFAAAIIAKDWIILVFGALILFDSLLIIQNSRRCLHDLIAKTIVVKVFPGKNDSPYGSLRDAIGATTLVVVVSFLLVFLMIPAYSDYLERRRVSEAIEFLNAQKGPVESYLVSHDSFPPLGKKILLTKSRYTVSLVSNPEEFYFEATMSEEEDVLAGKVVRLIYHPDTKTWTCSAAYPNGIPQKYLPSVCKE